MSSAPRTRTALALSVWLLLVALAVLQIVRTTFVADLSAFLPGAPEAGQRLLMEQLQSGAPARTLLVGIEGGTAPQRAEASRALARALHASSLFEQVNNGEREQAADIGRWLFEHRYQLSPAVEPARFTAVGLRDAIDETLSLLGTPAGAAIKPVLERDPTGETLRIAEGLIPASAPRTEEGVWVSRREARALLVVSTRAAGADLDGQAAAIEHLRSAFAALPQVGLTLKVSGAPVFGVESRRRIETAAHVLAITGTVLVAALLWVAFASLRALAVAFVPVASGVLAGVAAVSLAFGHTVHGITLGFGTTLIGEAVDYAIYYLIQARAGGWQGWLRNGWPTLRLGLLTSVCGFAALLFSGFEGLMQLGVFSIAGLVAATLATRYVMPPLMPAGAPGLGLRRQLGNFGTWLVRQAPRARWPLIVLAAASLLLLVQRNELWRADLASLSPIPKDALALDARLRADLGAGDGGTLVAVQAADVQATLQQAEAVAQRLETLIDSGKLGGFDTVTRLLPSLATQALRQAALPEAAALQAALQPATQGGPLPAARLAPFVADVQAARTLPALTPASLRGSAVSPLVDALLLQRADGSAAAMLSLHAPASGPIDRALLTAALQGLPGVQVLEVGRELNRLYERYLERAQLQALLGALAVVLLMGAWLRSWRRLLAVCQPLLLAVLLTMGGLTALGVQLGILHLMGLLLVVAVGSNYALFFDLLRQPGQDSADAETLASLLLANATIVLSFALLAVSGIPALAAVGQVVAPGTLLALLLSAALAPKTRA